MRLKALFLGAVLLAAPAMAQVYDANGKLIISTDYFVFVDDAAFTLTSSSLGVMGGIRDDALTTLSAAEGDAVPFRLSSTGALHVTGGGGGTEYTEDVATANPQVGTATMMERDNALATVTPAEGDWIGLRGSAEGALWTQEFNSDAILADTANMDTNLGTVAGAVATGQMQVDIVADGAGLATAANQLADGHNVTVDNASIAVTGGGGTQYAVQDVGGATDTVTMAGVIRDDSLTTLTASDGDVARLRVGSTGALHVTGGGGGTEYTEDVATANPQVGTATMVERDDALSSVTPVEGDWIGLRGSAEGALWTQDFNSDSALTSLQKIDNVAHSGSDVVLVEHVPISGQFDDTATTSVTENQLAPLRINSSRHLLVDIATVSAAGEVDDTDTLTSGTTEGTPIMAAATPTDTAVDANDLGIVAMSLDRRLYVDADITPAVAGGGTEATAQRVTIASDSTGLLSIDDNAGSLTVDSGAAFTVQEDGAALTALQLIDDVVYVDDADWVDSTSKHALVGGLYQSSPQAVTDGDVAPLQITSAGALIVSGGGGGTEYTEDAAAAANPVGTALILIRDDAASGQTTADGDNIAQRGTDYGAAYVQVLDSSGSFVDSFGGSASVFVDDAPFTLTSSSITIGGGIRDDNLSTLSAVEGDATPFRLTDDGALHVAITPTGGNSVVVTSVIPGAGATALGKVEDGVNSTGDTGVAMMTHREDTPSSTTSTNNDYAIAKSDSVGRLWVNGSDVTQPISAASLPLPAGAATSAAQLADGHNVTVDNAAGGSAVNVQDGGNALTVDWAGTAPPVGAGVEATALRVTVATDSTGVLSVDDNAGSLTVDGTVTANAGTNLNTSALLTGADHNAAFGTAGTADAQVRSIQGIASGTPVEVDLAANNDVTVTSGTIDLGATDNAVLDDIANGIPLDANSGVDIGDVDVLSLPNEGQQTASNSISVTPDTDNDPIGATGAAPPGEATFVGGLVSGATGGFLGGITVCDSHVAVDIVTATTTLMVTGVAGRHVRICSINLVTADANNVALIAGTGATCGTSTAGINGGVTAAEGWNFAANGGLTLGGGLGEVMSTKVTGGATGDSVCIITSAAVQLSGTIAYTIY